MCQPPSRAALFFMTRSRGGLQDEKAHPHRANTCVQNCQRSWRHPIRQARDVPRTDAPEQSTRSSARRDGGRLRVRNLYTYFGNLCTAWHSKTIEMGGLYGRRSVKTTSAARSKVVHRVNIQPISKEFPSYSTDAHVARWIFVTASWAVAERHRDRAANIGAFNASARARRVRIPARPSGSARVLIPPFSRYACIWVLAGGPQLRPERDVDEPDAQSTACPG